MRSKIKGAAIAAAASIGGGAVLGGAGAEPLASTSDERAAALATLEKVGPVDMLNFIKFKEKADYPEGSGFEDKGWSGERAYQEYSRTIAKTGASYGASRHYTGDPMKPLRAPEGEEWDRIFVVRYPSGKAFVDFVTDPEYKKHAFHRAAAVADSRLFPLSQPAE